MAIPRLWERQPGELDKEWEAFTFYRENRPKTLEATAKELGIPLSTLYGWSSDLMWRERVAAYDRHIDRARVRAAETAAQRQGRTHARLLGKARRILDHEIAERLKDIEAGHHERMKDSTYRLMLETVVKLERLVAGESTERVDDARKVDFSKLSTEELEQYAQLHRKASVDQ